MSTHHDTPAHGRRRGDVLERMGRRIGLCLGLLVAPIHAQTTASVPPSYQALFNERAPLQSFDNFLTVHALRDLVGDQDLIAGFNVVLGRQRGSFTPAELGAIEDDFHLAEMRTYILGNLSSSQIPQPQFRVLEDYRFGIFMWSYLLAPNRNAAAQIERLFKSYFGQTGLFRGVTPDYRFDQLKTTCDRLITMGVHCRAYEEDIGPVGCVAGRDDDCALACLNRRVQLATQFTAYQGLHDRVAALCASVPSNAQVDDRWQKIDAIVHRFIEATFGFDPKTMLRTEPLEAPAEMDSSASEHALQVARQLLDYVAQRVRTTSVKDEAFRRNVRTVVEQMLRQEAVRETIEQARTALRGANVVKQAATIGYDAALTIIAGDYLQFLIDAEDASNACGAAQTFLGDSRTRLLRTLAVGADSLARNACVAEAASVREDFGTVDSQGLHY